MNIDALNLPDFQGRGLTKLEEILTVAFNENIKADDLQMYFKVRRFIFSFSFTCLFFFLNVRVLRKPIYHKTFSFLSSYCFSFDNLK
jgi:hypothetical protein